MEKLRLLAIFGTLLYSLGIVGCTKNLSDDIDDLKNRVTLLEEQTKQINKDIAGINDVIKAINGHEQITEVKELADKSGYSIAFSKDGKVTRTIEIKHGSTVGNSAPIIGIATHPTLNVFCWNQTINGVTTWLTDIKGNPIPLVCPTNEDGGTPVAPPAPEIGVDSQGYWTIDIKDGSGVKRMKDTDGNDVKATGKDGETGPSGALGFTLSADGRYAIFTISGTEYKFEISSLTIGFSEYGIIYVEPTGVRTLDIILPKTFKKSDFTAISAKIEGKNSGENSSDAVTRATAKADWVVNLTKPTYKSDETIDAAPKVEITAPTGATVGQAGVLTITLTLSDGKQISSSRAVEIMNVSAVTYIPDNDEFTLPIISIVAGAAPKNVKVSVDKDFTAAQTFKIPKEFTKENTPVITLSFADQKSFNYTGADKATLTIEAPTYDGTIIIEGKDKDHAAIVNADDNNALEIIASNATIITQNIQITGGSLLVVSPNTFVVRSAIIGHINMNKGSVKIEKDGTVKSILVAKDGGSIDVQSGSTVTETITSKNALPIVISGEVKGAITSATAPVIINSGATTKEISSAGVTVAKGAVVDGAIESTGTNDVVLNGEVKGNVKVEGQANVTVGNEAKIGDASSTDAPAISAPNSPSVSIPKDAEINGPVEAPAYKASIAIGDKGYATIKAAVAAVKEGETIIIEKGEYPLTATTDENNNVVNDWYCKIDKENVTIKSSTTNANDVVLYGANFSINGSHGGQNLITIAATGVKMEYITIMPKVETNKAIEVLPEVAEFTLQNCNIVPNTKISSTVKTGGSVYTSGNTKITIENCYFEYARIRIGTGGEVIIKNNAFKGGQVWGDNGEINQWATIELWPDLKGSNPTTALLEGNNFTNLWDWENSSDEEKIAPINVGEGTLTMKDNTFPDGNLYWQTEKNGKIESAPAAVSTKWGVDRATCDDFAFTNNIVSFNTKTVAGTATEGFYAWQGVQTSTIAPQSESWEVETVLNLSEVSKQSARTIWLRVGKNGAPAEADVTYFCFGFIIKADGSKGWYWNQREGGSFLAEWVKLDSESVGTDPEKYTIKITNNNGEFNYFVNNVLLKTETISELTGATSVNKIFLNSRNSVNTPYETKWNQPKLTITK